MMVQIGNFHIGNAGTAVPPSCDVLEAGHIWDALVTRYDIIELTQKAHNFIHDKDFKLIVSTGLKATLERQADEIEKFMNDLMIPLPPRPEKSANFPPEPSYSDEFIFRLIFSGIQNMLDAHLRHVRSIVTNDKMRYLAMDFLYEEISIFNKMILYGKVKGWLRVTPKYKP